MSVRGSRSSRLHADSDAARGSGGALQDQGHGRILQWESLFVLSAFPIGAESFPCWQSESPVINCALVALANLSMEDLAARARLSRRTLSKWEGSSNAVPDAMVAHLSRALDVLEAEGVRFTDDNGASLQRPAPVAGTVVHSEAAASTARTSGCSR